MANNKWDVSIVLIEKIASCVNILYQPTHKVRMTKARDKCALIQQNTYQNLEKRTMNRVRHEEMSKQENIEKIITKALEQVLETAKPENIEKDFLVHFFDKCKNTSDEYMQSLWAKILAGEANNTGSFSKKTINIMADLSKKDAESFVNLLKFSFNDFQNNIFFIIDYGDVKKENNLYNQHDITVQTINNLTHLNLIEMQSSGCALQTSCMSFNYLSNQTIKITSSNKNIQLGHIKITPSGQQLAKIAKTNEKIDDYFKYTYEFFKKIYPNDTVEIVNS